MILTEEKNYTISLEKEESDSENGLTCNMIELEFSNKELLHEIITCGMPVQRLTVAYPEKKRLEMLYKMFVVEMAEEATETGDTVEEEVKDEKVEEEMEEEAKEAVPGIIRSIPPLK